MRFRCCICGQRYSTVDEPVPGRSYRIPCQSCGAAVLLGDGEYPALPAIPFGAPVPSIPEDAVGSAAPPRTVSLATPAEDVAAEPAPARRVRRRVRHRRRPRVRELVIAAFGLVALGGLGFLVTYSPADPASGTSLRIDPVPISSEPALASSPPGGDGATPPAPASPPLTGGARPSSAAAPPPEPSPPPRASPRPPAAASAPVPRPTRVERDAPPPIVAPAAAAAPRAPAAMPAPVVPKAPALGPSPAPVPEPVIVASDRAGERKGAEVERRPEPDKQPEGGLSSEQVFGIVSARQRDFASCVQAWFDRGASLGPGRRVTLSFTVAPSGAVGDVVRLDDPTLEGTALGDCLRRVASSLTFPAFDGMPLWVRIPLQLEGGRSGQ